MRRWLQRMSLLAGLWIGLPSGAADVVRIPLDAATPEQLATLDHIDLTLAQRIVALRDARGGLSSIEALRVLPGVSEEVLGSLRAGTSVKLRLVLPGDKTYATPADVLEEFDKEPDARTVQLWGEEYARVQPQAVTRMLRASKAFGALPRVKTYYRLADGWDNDFRRFDEFGVPPTSNAGQFEDVLTDASVGQDRNIYVEATWYLHDIVMSNEQLRVISEAQHIAKLREKILTEITRLYYERRRLQVDMLLNPKSDLLGQVRDELRLRELAANIDAYTGGRFSDALAPAR